MYKIQFSITLPSGPAITQRELVTRQQVEDYRAGDLVADKSMEVVRKALEARTVLEGGLFPPEVLECRLK